MNSRIASAIGATVGAVLTVGAVVRAHLRDSTTTTTALVDLTKYRMEREAEIADRRRASAARHPSSLPSSPIPEAGSRSVREVPNFDHEHTAEPGLFRLKDSVQVWERTSEGRWELFGLLHTAEPELGAISCSRCGGTIHDAGQPSDLDHS